MNSKYYRRLTPMEAWDYFAPYGVERFISEFLDDDRYDIAITDYKKMCRIYVRDFPLIYEMPFAQEDLESIAGLLEQYMGDYIEENRGVENLKLMSKEELDELWDEEVMETLRAIEESKNRVY